MHPVAHRAMEQRADRDIAGVPGQRHPRLCPEPPGALPGLTLCGVAVAGVTPVYINNRNTARSYSTANIRALHRNKAKITEVITRRARYRVQIRAFRV